MVWNLWYSISRFPGFSCSFRIFLAILLSLLLIMLWQSIIVLYSTFSFAGRSPVFNIIPDIQKQKQEEFCKKVFLKNFANFTENHTDWSFFLIKLLAPDIREQLLLDIGNCSTCFIPFFILFWSHLILFLIFFPKLLDHIILLVN